MKQKLFIALACCVAIFLVASCKPKQRIISTVSPVEDKANSELFTDILTNEFQYTTLQSKLNLDLINGNRSLSSRANLRIVRDRSLQVSVQPLFGVEVFRLYVDTDSLVVLDRMNKQYVKESLDTLKETYPVGFDYYTLQSLFTNAVFIAGKTDRTASDYSVFRYSQTPDARYQLKAADEDSGIEYAFTINGNDRVIFSHLMQPQEKYSLQWEYGNFASVQEQFFPHKMDITAKTSSRKMEMGVTFSDIVINNPMELGIVVPSGYTRVELIEIIKMLSEKK